jgi:capsular polysaccharide biosynthesis protein
MYSKALENEYYSSLKDILGIIWGRKWALLAVVVILVGAAVGLSYLQTPVYESSAKLLMGRTQPEGDDALTLNGSDVQGLQQITQTMTVAVGSKPIAESVIQQLDLQMAPETLLNNLTVQQVQDTQFIEIAYKDTDPERARRIVNAVGDVAAQRISESTAGANVIKATVWEYAAVPEAPVSPDPLRNGILALGLGLMLGIGLIFLLEHLDDSWRSTEEVEQVSGVPNFGVIPEFDLVKIRKARGA